LNKKRDEKEKKVQGAVRHIIWAHSPIKWQQSVVFRENFDAFGM
jgi:hypothetical protein